MKKNSTKNSPISPLPSSIRHCIIRCICLDDAMYIYANRHILVGILEELNCGGYSRMTDIELLEELEHCHHKELVDKALDFIRATLNTKEINIVQDVLNKYEY